MFEFDLLVDQKQDREQRPIAWKLPELAPNHSSHGLQAQRPLHARRQFNSRELLPNLPNKVISYLSTLQADLVFILRRKRCTKWWTITNWKQSKARNPGQRWSGFPSSTLRAFETYEPL